MGHTACLYAHAHVLVNKVPGSSKLNVDNMVSSAPSTLPSLFSIILAQLQVVYKVITHRPQCLSAAQDNIDSVFYITAGHREES